MPDKKILTAIDANINRSIEGLRVCEDIFRFYQRHPISSAIKESRHRITSLAVSVMPDDILYYRDVEGDAQKFIDTPGELKRESISEVFRSNIRRAAEAIRSLEEFTKMIDSSISSEFQKLRFAIYSIEQQGWGIIEKSHLINRFRNSLYAIIDSGFVADAMIEESAEILAGSGADIIQLRMKNVSDRDFLFYAERVAAVCRKNDVLFIVNDRADIALMSNAHGLHLGQEDIPLERICEITGGKLLKGLSVNSVETAEAGLKTDADYIAAGPVFATTSKNGESLEGIGLEVIKKVCSMADRPVIAIGGIQTADVAALLDAGCSGIAVISELYRDEKLSENAKRLSQAVKRIKSC